MSPPRVIDMCLRAVEGMSGIEVNDATVNVNGSHIGSTKVDGMIAVGVADHEIDNDDINRISDAAIAGKIPANREILSLVPYEYILDGQGGIREPFGMHGARLELRANVISALTPDCENIRKVCDAGNLRTRALEPSALAAARAVITNAQKENGVGLLDMGSATTGVAIFDEGELQFIGVVPIGSNDITNDLATVLKTVPEIAEEIKVRFATGSGLELEERIGVGAYNDAEKSREILLDERQEADPRRRRRIHQSRASQRDAPGRVRDSLRSRWR